LKVPKNEAL